MNGFFWARRYMFKQKRRTLLTAFGIALAIALVCGTGVLFDSFREMMITYEIQGSGNWHYDISNMASPDDARTLIANRAFEAGSMYTNDVYAQFTGKRNVGGVEVDTDYYLQVFEGDADYVAMSNIEYVLKAGRLPENSGEIVISTSAREKLRSVPSLGDKLTLPVGTVDYVHGDQEKDDVYNFTQTGTRTYTVVGFCDLRTNLNRTYYAFSMPDGGAHSWTARVRLHPTPDYGEAVEKAIEQSGLKRDTLNLKNNYGLIRYSAQGMDSGVQNALLLTCGLLVAIILTMMMLVVRNTFAISIDEKMQQFGVLRCLGASRKSIRSMVRCEALMLWGLAAPVGVAGALAAMQIIFAVINSLDSDVLRLLRLHWSAWPFALALGVSLVCVLLAAASPARKCARVSPVGAVRGEASLRSGVKKARGGRMLKHVLGFPGLMSARNMRRNPRKYRATLLSVACSIALFMLMSGFANSFGQTVHMYSGLDGMDVLLSSANPVNRDELEEKLKQLDMVDKIVEYQTVGAEAIVPDERYTDDIKALSAETHITLETLGYINIRSIGRDEFEQLTFEGKAPTYEEFCRPGSVVLMQKMVLAGSRSGLSVMDVLNYRPGDNIDIQILDGAVNEKVSYNVVGILKSTPWFCTYNGAVSAYIAEANLPGNISPSLTFSMKAYEGREDELSSAIDEMEYSSSMLALDWSINDVYGMNKENRALIQVLDIFLYGFTAVIVLICSMNLLNTIKTNMHSRRREMSMLRAIGMSRKQMYRMLFLECVWYAVLGTLLGLIIGVPLEMLLIISASGMITMEFGGSLLVAQSVLCMVVTCGIALIAGSGPIRQIVNLPATEGIRAIE